MKRHIKHSRSATILGLLVLIIAVILLFWLSVKVFQTESTDSIQNDQTDIDQNGQLSPDEVATIGQNYITSLASYDQDQQQPILLSDNQQMAEGLYIVRYEVRQVFKERTQMYFYTLTIQDGYVKENHVSVSDRDRVVLISLPEPEQITTSTEFVVKGQVFDGQDNVVVRLLDQESMGLVLEQIVPIQTGDSAIFSLKMQDQFPEGELIVEVQAGESIVRSPFIYLPQKS